MVLMIFTGIFALISGFILSLPVLIDQNAPLTGIKDATDPFKVYIAIADILLALINLFGATDIILIGNLLPGIALLLTGIGLSDDLLVYINFSKDNEISEQRKTKVKSFIKKSAGLIGIVTFIVGILHFILWKILIF